MLSILFLILLTSGIVFAGPQAVSPGDDGKEAVITEVCPTFSWSEVEGAEFYRVEVYEMVISNILSHDDIASVSQPVISKDVGRALS